LLACDADAALWPGLALLARVCARALLAAVLADERALLGVLEALSPEACADFCSSWAALCSDRATAPCAFWMSRVSPSTPGAEPW
jgi:hypothetical protein